MAKTFGDKMVDSLPFTVKKKRLRKVLDSDAADYIPIVGPINSLRKKVAKHKSKPKPKKTTIGRKWQRHSPSKSKLRGVVTEMMEENAQQAARRKAKPQKPPRTEIARKVRASDITPSGDISPKSLRLHRKKKAVRRRPPQMSTK